MDVDVLAKGIPPARQEGNSTTEKMMDVMQRIVVT